MTRELSKLVYMCFTCESRKFYRAIQIEGAYVIYFFVHFAVLGYLCKELEGTKSL